MSSKKEAFKELMKNRLDAPEAVPADTLESGSTGMHNKGNTGIQEPVYTDTQNPINEVTSGMKEAAAAATNLDVQLLEHPETTKKKKSTFDLDPDLHKWLKVTAAVDERDMVDIVEEALILYRKFKQGS